MWPADIVFTTYIYNHWLTHKYSEFWLVRYNGLVWSNIAVLNYYHPIHMILELNTKIFIWIMFNYAGNVPLILVLSCLPVLMLILVTVSVVLSQQNHQSVVILWIKLYFPSLIATAGFIVIEIQFHSSNNIFRNIVGSRLHPFAP